MDSKVKRGLVAAAGIVLGISLSFGVIKYRDNRLEQSKINAVTYIKDNKFEEAIEEYKNIMLDESNNPKWIMKIAEAYALNGEFDKCEQYLDKLKGFEDKDGDIARDIIYLHFMNGDEYKALEEGEEALTKHSDNKELQELMILIYKSNNQADKAMEIINNFEVDESSVYELVKHAKMLMLVEKNEEAYDLLEKAWEIDKDEIAIYDVLSQMSTYNKDKLLQDIQVRYSKDTSKAIYRMWLAKVYSLSDSTAETALGIIEQLEEEKVDSKELEYIKLSSLQFAGKSEEAKKLAEELESKYNDYTVYHTLAWYYFNDEQYDKAKELAFKSIDVNESYADNYGFLMPEILTHLEDAEGVNAYYMKAISKEPFNHNIMIKYANFNYKQDKRDEALKYFNIAAALKPLDTEIKYTMAFIYLKNNENEKAIPLLDKCIELSKENPIPKYYRTLGTIYMFLGNGDEAYKNIRAAYEADEEDILTLNNAGVYYISMKQAVERGQYNLLKAFEGLNDSYDEDVIKTIEENFKKADDLLKQYYDGEDNAEIEIPDFVLFY